MRSLSIICLLGLIVSLALAAPAPSRIQKRTFTVERVKNPNFVRRDGPKQLLKAYRKFGLRPPQALVDRLNNQTQAAKEATAALESKKKGGKKSGSGNTTTTTTSDATNTTSSDGIVTNTPTSGDVEYLSPVTIGGQTLNLDFDTGSSDLWVFNTDLSTKQQTGHTLFDSSQSTSFSTLTGQTFSISYGDGSAVKGTVGTDTVNIGGATVTKQAVELATTVSSSFVSDTSSDGLLGLAFSKLNTVTPTQQKTFFDNIMSSLNEPLFAADLRANATGTYQFGAIDTSKFSGDLTYASINTTEGFWQFSSTSFAIGDAAAQTSTSPGQAIADTGTTLLLASTDIVNAYFTGISGATEDASVGGVVFPCDTDLPDLQLDIGGSMATINGSLLNFEEISSGTCYSGLQAIDSDLMIFGDIFFKSNYVVFNGGNNTLAFAPHA